MVFKQNVLKEEKIKFIIIIATIVFLQLFIAIISFKTISDWKYAILVLILFLPIDLLIILINLNYLEWFHIFDDKIEVCCIYGTKNIVKFENIKFVEETNINLTSRGMTKIFYIFNDGRKSNANIFNFNSCYNKKKFNVRIYKTSQLEDYINGHLKLKIITK